MFFPIGDDQVKGGSFPLFSYAFIGINVVIYFYQMGMSDNELHAFFDMYAVQPAQILQGKELYTLFTSMFLHGSLMHLIGNMLFLWVFADNIEATVGNFRFLIFYLLGGLAADFGHIYFNHSSNIFSLGASGAISAVMGAYLVMFPRSRIRVLVLIIFRAIEVWAILFLGIWIVQQVVAGIGNLGNEGSGVAWWAHIGGFAFGLIYGIFNIGKARKFTLH